MEKTDNGTIRISYVLIRFFISFTLPMLVVFAIISYIYNEDKNSDLNIFILKERLEVEFKKDLILTMFESYYSDILFLQKLNDLHEFFPAEGDTFSIHNNHAFRSFIKQKRIYDQIRLIDADGYETFRINNNFGAPVIVEKNNLQYKGDRPYFIDGIKLNQNEVFVSPMDLNIENNVIEKKPMIRFAMPVFSHGGDKKGIIVLNFLGINILNPFTSSHSDFTRHLMLVNNDGYWLKGMKEEDEWGWMYNDRGDRKFQMDFPDEWGEISTRDSGMVYNSKGLFTYSTLQPLYENSELRQYCPNCRDIEWHIVSYVPAVILKQSSKKLFFRLATLSLILMIVLAFSSVFFTIAGIRRKSAVQALRDAAHKDALTGLSNRREFGEKFDYEVIRFERNNRPLSLIICDIDHFKKINDTYGHDCGDAILVTLSALLKKTLRAQDVIGRWGGEEFVILLPETDVNKGEVTAEKLRKAVENENFSYKKLNLKVTMSFGICEYVKGQSLEACVKTADVGLYEAKRLGRNQVVKSSA